MAQKFTDEQRAMAAAIANHLSSKSSRQSTKISGKAETLWNEVGGENFKRLVMFYIRQIAQGINHRYAGRNMFNKGSIHPQKQKFINALYMRLVRERVMPDIYAYFLSNVQPGAFVKTLIIDEDIPNLRGPIVYDESAAVENQLEVLMNRLKYNVFAAEEIVSSIKSGQPLDELDIDSYVDGDEEEEDSDAYVPDFLPQENPEPALAGPENNAPEEEEDSREQRIQAEQDRIHQNYLEAMRRGSFIPARKRSREPASQVYDADDEDRGVDIDLIPDSPPPAPRKAKKAAKPARRKLQFGAPPPSKKRSRVASDDEA